MLKKLLLFLVFALAVPLAQGQSSALSNAAKLRGILTITDPIYAGGAKCDDSTDDQAAIAAALAAAASSGKSVYVPAGICRHSSTLAVAGITLFGDGDVSVLKATSGTDSALIMTGTGTTIRDLRLTGASSASIASSSNAAAILVNNAVRFRIEGVSSETFRFPHFDVIGGTDGVITRNRLADGWGGVFMHNAVADVKRVVVSQNNISGMKDDSIASVGGSASITTQNEDILIQGNIIKDQTTSGRGIVVLGTKRASVIGNLIQNVTAASGILIGFDSFYSTRGVDDLVVEGNVVNDTGTTSLSSVLLVANGTITSNNIMIRNNLINGGGRASISVTGAGTPGMTKLSIIGNTLRNPTVTAGFEGDYVRDLIFTDNLGETIPQYCASFGTSMSGHVVLNGNIFRDTNTANSGSVDCFLFLSSSITDISVNGNIRNGTNAIERGVENNVTTATLRGSGNAFNGATGGSSTTLGGLNDFLRGSATFNPADLADGAGETTTVTVSGASLGDFAEVSFSLDLQGIILTGYVSAADTVSARFQNEAGAGNINLGSGTLRATVRKR